MSAFVVIDTETTWTDDVMSIGAIVADSMDYSVIDSRYCAMLQNRPSEE